MDADVEKALSIAREKVRDGKIKDFELLLDITQMRFVWVSEEAAKISGHTVPELIGNNFFETTDISQDELRNIIVELSKTGGKYAIPVTSRTGVKHIEMEFKPLYVTKERPFLVGNIIGGV